MINKEEACDELLNPEKTLERLANPEPQKGETEETDGEPPKKKNSLIVKTAVLVGILVIVGGLLLGYMIKHREPTYQQIGTRYIDDPDWGNVSEISYMKWRTAEFLNKFLELIGYLQKLQIMMHAGWNIQSAKNLSRRFRNW